MSFELKAEYEFRAVRAWHIVQSGESRGLCGNPLAPASTTLPIDEMHQVFGVCRPCEVLHFGAVQRGR